MAGRDPNWAQLGNLLPIASLSDAYDGPVVLANVTDERTITWFAAKANKDAVDHVEHVQGGEGEGFLHDDDGEPVTETSSLKPTHWAIAQVIK